MRTGETPRPRLLDPASVVGFVGEVSVPGELYFVSRSPVVIAGMGYPARVDWSRFAAEGIGHVVCLTHGVAPYDAAPLRVSAVGLEDLWTASRPSDPVVEMARVGTAAELVVESVLAGEGVVVHCRGGRGRAGTVLGVALVRLGHDAEAMVGYLDTLHTRRGKLGWPESSWQAEMVHRLGRPSEAGVGGATGVGGEAGVGGATGEAGVGDVGGVGGAGSGPAGAGGEAGRVS